MYEFQKQQAELAAHIRNPEKNPAPSDIEERRLKVYTELFFNNIEGFIAGSFPVLKSLHTEEAWLSLARQFVEHHQSHTPYFLEISEEFLKFLDDESLDIHQQFPFAKELAHYEWMELALDVADETHNIESINANGDLLAEKPVVSALAWPTVYQWPVHQISQDAIPDAPNETPTCVIVYRDRVEDVAFLEVNPVTLRLIELLDDEVPVTGTGALHTLAQEMGQDDVQAIVQFGAPILEQLRSLGIILGTAID